MRPCFKKEGREGRQAPKTKIERLFQSQVRFKKDNEDWLVIDMES